MLGNILKYIRVCNDYSVKQVSNSINIASTYICDIENNRKKPSFDMFYKFADCYNIEASKIIYFEELEKMGKSRKEILKEVLEYYIEKENVKILKK